LIKAGASVGSEAKERNGLGDMIAEMMKLASIVRLKGILKSRYGKGLEITTMVDSDEIPRGEGCLLRGNSLLIPISANGHYLATAIVPKADDIQESDRQAITHLVRMILEPEFYSWYLDQMTHNSLHSHSLIDTNIDTNIVSLHLPLELGADLPDETLFNEDADGGTHVLFLEAASPAQIQKIAVDIHEVSERWAYLRFQDIKDQILSVQNLAELGSLTLFVDDILNIGDFHREILVSYLQHPHSVQEPLILIGSSTSLRDLLSHDMLHPDLARLLESHRLEVERLPRTRDLFREAIEMVL
jgi:hypothetical protein